MNDHYEMLGVEPGASKDEIRGRVPRPSSRTPTGRSAEERRAGNDPRRRPASSARRDARPGVAGAERPVPARALRRRGTHDGAEVDDDDVLDVEDASQQRRRRPRPPRPAALRRRRSSPATAAGAWRRRAAAPAMPRHPTGAPPARAASTAPRLAPSSAGASQAMRHRRSTRPYRWAKASTSAIDADLSGAEVLDDRTTNAAGYVAVVVSVVVIVFFALLRRDDRAHRADARQATHGT